MPAEVNNAFDIAFFFTDTALAENEHLQPQKLQGLLFLSQAYFSVAFKGRKLMPAVFVADERGPLEPNVFTAFSKGRPDIDTDLFLHAEVESFLDAIWRRFGHMSTEKIIKMTKDTSAYKKAKNRGHRAEIFLSDIRVSFIHAENTPGVNQVVKPKLYRTQSGKNVTVQKWMPGTKPANESPK